MKKYQVYFIFIILFALCLRVYRFESRVFFFSDNARDAIVAREALRTLTIPQIASFSSAGPFVFGPEYYWFLMSAYLLNPNNILMPYYFLVGLSVVFLVLMMLVAKCLLNNKFSLLTGLIIAVSPRQIFRSMSMTQHTVVAVCAAAALYFLVKFFKEKKSRQIFWCAFFVSLAISLHYQSLGLLIFGAVIIFVKAKLKRHLWFFAAFALGAILPILPFFLWDAKQNFANINNLLDYLLIGQYRIYVANRWLWHIFDFWPSTIADIFGGNKVIGGILLYLSFSLALTSFFRKKLSTELKLIFAIFFVFFIYLRYYRAEKFEGYLMYLHPLIFIVISWGVYKMFKFKKILWTIGCFVFIANFFTISREFIQKNGNEIEDLKRLTKKIEKEVGVNKKIAVYDFAVGEGQTETSDFSQALVLYLDTKNKLNFENGGSIGLCKNCDAKEMKCVEIKDDFVKRYNYHIVTKCIDFKRHNLVARSPNNIYLEILFWWKKRPLKSTFNLFLYLKERII